MVAGMRVTDLVPMPTAWKDIEMYQADACMVHSMPSDWPLRKMWSKEGIQHYEVARRSDPSLPDPDLSP
jgi:hypothetical protein